MVEREGDGGVAGTSSSRVDPNALNNLVFAAAAKLEAEVQRVRADSMRDQRSLAEEMLRAEAKAEVLDGRLKAIRAQAAPPSRLPRPQLQHVALTHRARGDPAICDVEFRRLLDQKALADREKVIDERECELATRAKKLDAAHASRTAELEARMRRVSSKEQQLIDREMQLASREKQLLQKATHQPRQPRAKGQQSPEAPQQPKLDTRPAALQGRASPPEGSSKEGKGDEGEEPGRAKEGAKEDDDTYSGESSDEGEGEEEEESEEEEEEPVKVVKVVEAEAPPEEAPVPVPVVKEAEVKKPPHAGHLLDLLAKGSKKEVVEVAVEEEEDEPSPLKTEENAVASLLDCADDQYGASPPVHRPGREMRSVLKAEYRLARIGEWHMSSKPGQLAQTHPRPASLRSSARRPIVPGAIGPLFERTPGRPASPSRAGATAAANQAVAAAQGAAASWAAAAAAGRSEAAAKGVP